MTVELAARERAPGMPAAAAAVLRATAGLLVHAVVRPGQPALIDRATGQVRPR